MTRITFRAVMIATLTAGVLTAPLTLPAAQLQSNQPRFSTERFAPAANSPGFAGGTTLVGATPISIPRTVDRSAVKSGPINPPALDPGLGP